MSRVPMLPVSVGPRAALTSLVTGATLVVLAAPVTAHVGVTSTDSAPGSSVVASFAVGHGCAGSPTTALTIDIPAELSSVTPVRHPAWEVATTHADAADEEAGEHGHDDAGRVASVTFTAREPLPDGIRDAVQLAFTLPEREGTDLVFPTVQVCEEGETAWTQVAASGQDPHDLESPAPVLTVGVATTQDDASEGAESDAAVTSSLTWSTAALAVVALLLSGGALARTRGRG